VRAGTFNTWKVRLSTGRSRGILDTRRSVHHMIKAEIEDTTYKLTSAK
jgi:hypothetical protein